MADCGLVASCLLLPAHFSLLFHPLQFLYDLLRDLPQIYADKRPPAVLLLLRLDADEIHAKVLVEAAVKAEIIQITSLWHLFMHIFKLLVRVYPRVILLCFRLNDFFEKFVVV